VQKPPKS
jgi:hypothetical protein